MTDNIYEIMVACLVTSYLGYVARRPLVPTWRPKLYTPYDAMIQLREMIDDVEAMFVMIQSHDEGHPSHFQLFQTPVGHSGPKYSHVSVHGVSIIIILYMVPVEAMSQSYESFMWVKGLSCQLLM